MLNWEKERTPPRTIDLGRVIAFLDYDPLPLPTTVQDWLLYSRRKHGWSIQLLTQTLKQALALVDIRVLDHFVVAGTTTVSFAERALI